MIFIAETLASWLIGQIADLGRKRLGLLVLGSDQERSLRQAARAAIYRTVTELCPEQGEQSAELSMVLDEVFREPIRREPTEEHATLLQTLQAGIARQLEPLGQSDISGMGISSAQLLGISPITLTETLTSHLIREILVRGAVGGPLAPLANQLNHDATHLQSQRLEDMLARLTNNVRGELTSLQDGLTVSAGAVVTRSLPADVASFTGRRGDLNRLIRGLLGQTGAGGSVRIYAINGMAGIGKTAFAVHLAHRVAPRFPDGQMFLRLHAHTPGHRPVEPGDALGTMLLTAGVAPQQIPTGIDERSAMWRDQIAGRRIILLIDDVISSEQVKPLLPGVADALVLVTSRRRLTALPEAIAITLDTLKPGEAAQLFTRSVERSSRLPREDVARIAELCGHLPLAIRIIGAQLKHHPAWTSRYMIDELVSGSDRLIPMNTESESVATSFQLSYRNLRADQQLLFRRLGLHSGVDIDVYAAAALNDTSPAVTQMLLDELYNYHLLDELAPRRYRFHDLVRGYARVLSVTDESDGNGAAVDRLLDYYLYVARAADTHLALRTPAGVPDTGISPRFAPNLPTREDALKWMDLERVNLAAAVNHAAVQNRACYAMAIPAALDAFLRIQGHWDEGFTLHRTAFTIANSIDNAPAAANALTDMEHLRCLKGNYPEAKAGLTQALSLYRKTGDRLGQANVLKELGTVDYLSGNYPEAKAGLTQALDLYRKTGDRLGQANVLKELGNVQQAAGEHRAANGTLMHALGLYRELGNLSGEVNSLILLGGVQLQTFDLQTAVTTLGQALKSARSLNDRLAEANALFFLGHAQCRMGDYIAAAENLTQALELYRSRGNPSGEANCHSQLGVAQYLTKDYRAAIANLGLALNLSRRIKDQAGEANTLSHLGAAQQAMGDYPASTDSLTQALNLCRRLGIRDGEAEVLNNTGELFQVTATTARARSCHEQALAIASDIGLAFEEARALEGIGQCHLRDSQHSQGVACFRQALRIYQRIGSPYAHRIDGILYSHDV
jgi:tetratricopeptide (TPR) repeat protein